MARWRLRRIIKSPYFLILILFCIIVYQWYSEPDYKPIDTTVSEKAPVKKTEPQKPKETLAVAQPVAVVKKSEIQAPSIQQPPVNNVQTVVSDQPKTEEKKESPVLTSTQPPAIESKETPLEKLLVGSNPVVQNEMTEYYKVLQEIKLAKAKEMLIEQEARIAEMEQKKALALSKLATAQKERALIQSKGDATESGEPSEANLIEYFQLHMLIQKQDIWYGMLSLGKKYYNVRVGSYLPGGVKVIQANANSILLKNGTQQRLLKLED